MTNLEVRQWYVGEVAKIAGMVAEWQAQGESLEAIARQACQRRHDLRVRARSMMLNAVEVAKIQARDQLQYGHPDGPTFENLRDELLSQNLSLEDTLQRIITGASSTSEEFNQLMGISPRRPK